jgi:hypothetical protein
MGKLTLSVDSDVISRAKRYARQQGVSVSQVVEVYLASMSKSQVTQEVPPVLKSLRGSLKKVDVEDYRKHLSRKYK